MFLGIQPKTLFHETQHIFLRELISFPGINYFLYAHNPHICLSVPKFHLEKQTHIFNYLFFSFLFSWQCCTACGLLAPWPGIEPPPLALEVQSLNHWTTREVPQLSSVRCHPTTSKFNVSQMEFIFSPQTCFRSCVFCLSGRYLSLPCLACARNRGIVLLFLST